MSRPAVDEVWAYGEVPMTYARIIAVETQFVCVEWLGRRASPFLGGFVREWISLSNLYKQGTKTKLMPDQFSCDDAPVQWPHKSLEKWQQEIHAVAVSKGWHPDADHENLWKMLGNIHGEVSEAWEEARKPDFDMRRIYLSEKGKPEGLPIELADVIIRTLDLCELYGIDIEKAMNQKHAYNKTRPFRHGNKRA